MRLFSSVRTQWDGIICQVVTYRRLKTIEKFKLSAQKVASYESWSVPTRGSNYSDLTENILVFWNSGRGQKMVAYDMWSHRKVRL